MNCPKCESKLEWIGDDSIENTVQSAFVCGGCSINILIYEINEQAADFVK